MAKLSDMPPELVVKIATHLTHRKGDIAALVHFSAASKDLRNILEVNQSLWHQAHAKFWTFSHAGRRGRTADIFNRKTPELALGAKNPLLLPSASGEFKRRQQLDLGIRLLFHFVMQHPSSGDVGSWEIWWHHGGIDAVDVIRSIKECSLSSDVVDHEILHFCKQISHLISCNLGCQLLKQTSVELAADRKEAPTATLALDSIIAVSCFNDCDGIDVDFNVENVVKELAFSVAQSWPHQANCRRSADTIACSCISHSRTSFDTLHKALQNLGFDHLPIEDPNAIGGDALAQRTFLRSAMLLRKCRASYTLCVIFCAVAKDLGLKCWPRTIHGHPIHKCSNVIVTQRLQNEGGFECTAYYSSVQEVPSGASNWTSYSSTPSACSCAPVESEAAPRSQWTNNVFLNALLDVQDAGAIAALHPSRTSVALCKAAWYCNASLPLPLSTFANALIVLEPISVLDWSLELRLRISQASPNTVDGRAYLQIMGQLLVEYRLRSESDEEALSASIELLEAFEKQNVPVTAERRTTRGRLVPYTYGTIVRFKDEIGIICGMSDICKESEQWKTQFMSDRPKRGLEQSFYTVFTATGNRISAAEDDIKVISCASCGDRREGARGTKKRCARAWPDAHWLRRVESCADFGTLFRARKNAGRCGFVISRAMAPKYPPETWPPSANACDGEDLSEVEARILRVSKSAIDLARAEAARTR